MIRNCVDSFTNLKESQNLIILLGISRILELGITTLI